MSDPKTTESRSRRRRRHRPYQLIITLVAAVAMGCFMVLYLASALWQIPSGHFELVLRLLSTKYQVIVGLPAAAITAFIVVALFRQQSGPIEFEGFGFKLRGASGPVILWMLCFMAIVSAIKWLW